MKKLLVFISAAGLALGTYFFFQPSNATSNADGMVFPQLRAEWEHMLLQDPETGEIPVTRSQELAFASHLPKADWSNQRTEYYNWQARGPFNFGGRTRGFAVDKTNDSTLIAGSISGHIFKSINQGESWYRTTNNTQTWGITCLIQDPRTGKENIWYAGSGESYNSASQGTGARFIGNGILKSTDNGESWTSLESTQTQTPQLLNEWDRIWRIAVDPTSNNDVVLAGILGGIMRSTDGGLTWETTLSSGGSKSFYSDIAVTSTGVFYATLSSDGTNDGIFRSDDGVNWTKISPSIFPNQYGRVVLGIDPNNENDVYFLADTPGSGKKFTNFRGDVEWISFWKYSYIDGDGAGAGGYWENRSQNLPAGPYKFDDLNLQGGYNMLVAVQPGNSNNVIIGGTNLFRSTSAFADSTSTTFIGGYEETTDLPDFQIYENHHPDQHKFFFLNATSNVAFSANDGGVFRTQDITSTPVVWQSLNNGYNTTQFYSVAIDHTTEGSVEMMGGLQDNGTFYTNSEDPFQWKFPWSYDGAFTAIGNGGNMHLTSIQLGRMFKVQLDANGNRTGWKRFDPIGGAGYYFIHPWAMDPNNNGIVYLPLQSRLWRNDSVADLPIDNGADSISTGWTQLNFNMSGQGSAVGISTANPKNRVYVGTSSGKCYRVDSADSNPVFTDVSNFLNGSGFLNCIAVDPENGDHAMAIFSNYNVHSIHFTEDGGQTWFRAGGNLESDTVPSGFPEDFYHISAAPSVRWAKIMNVAGEKVYLVGTSVGLFGTKSLAYGTDLASDTTQWKQLAPDEIGNHVVMMIDARESDDYVAVATHGGGMYSAHIPHAWGVTQTEEITAIETEISLYPNPTHAELNIQLEGYTDGVIDWAIYDLNGKMISQSRMAIRANKTLRLNVESLSTGTYFIQLKQGDQIRSKKFIKN